MKNSTSTMQHVETGPRWTLFILQFSLCVAMVASAGCSYVYYPRAGDYLEQAKARTVSGVEVILNLTAMLDASAKAARGENYRNDLDDLHNQFHALKQAFSQVNETQAATPAYAKAVTIKKEMGTVFRRLWKYQDDPALRKAHVDLFVKRVQELREAIQAIKS